MREWNWKVPAQWKWAKLGDIATWASGGTPKATESKYYGGSIPWLIIGDLNNGVVNTSAKTITEMGLQESSARFVEPGSIMVAMYGSIGKLGIAGIRCTTNQAIAFTHAISDEIEPKYLFHYLASIRDLLLAEGKGGAQANISQQVLRETPFCYPPRAMQRSLAKKLDRIASRFDDTKTHLDTIPAILKRFRASVLAAACSGRLTEGWRRIHPQEGAANILMSTARGRAEAAAQTNSQLREIEARFSFEEEGNTPELPEGWSFVALDKLATFNYGTSAKSQSMGRVPVLRMGNLQGGKIDWTDLAYSSDQREITKYSLKPRTVLFNRTNSPELVGKSALYSGERPAIFAGYLIRINAGPELAPEYLSYCLNSPAARAWCRQVKTDGVSQSNINAKKLGKFEIPLCSIAEQREIARRVEVMFHQADAIENRFRGAKAFTDKVLSSVLAKAFRGELCS